MCIAVPMELIHVDERSRTGTVLFSGNEMKVNLSLIAPKVGDYVLIHAGCAIETVDRESAEEILGLFETLEESAREP